MFGIGGPPGVPTGGVIGGVPPGGQQVFVTVGLDSPAPDLGVLSYNVSYAAQGPGNYPTSGVTGPSQFGVTAQQMASYFPITVFPCHGGPCRVIVTVSDYPPSAYARPPVQGILQVNP